MPIYQYQGKHYDLSETDPAAAKAKIQAYLSTQPPAEPAAAAPFSAKDVGLALAQGKTLQQAVDALGHVAEGVYCARTVVQRARMLGVEMPIAQSVVDLLDGRLQPAQAVAALMGRGPAVEGSPRI